VGQPPEWMADLLAGPWWVPALLSPVAAVFGAVTLSGAMHGGGAAGVVAGLLSGLAALVGAGFLALVALAKRAHG